MHLLQDSQEGSMFHWHEILRLQGRPDLSTLECLCGSLISSTQKSLPEIGLTSMDYRMACFEYSLLPNKDLNLYSTTIIVRVIANRSTRCLVLPEFTHKTMHYVFRISRNCCRKIVEVGIIIGAIKNLLRSISIKLTGG